MTATICSILISLALPAVSDPASQAPAANRATAEMFVTSDQCMACHNGLVSPAGEDVSIGSDWRPTMMANSARDPYWQAGVRREIMDHPMAQAVIENECSACHMPMARYEAKTAGRHQGVFSQLPVPGAGYREGLLAADGVSCTTCHQILPDGLGTRQSFVAGFKVDHATPVGERRLFGPFEPDAGRRTIMRSAAGFVPVKGEQTSSSEMCATCHTLFTHTLSPTGEVVGELPEQVPYLEWKHSNYRGRQGCPDCHLVPVEGKMAVSSVLGEPREAFSRHRFQGGNFLIPRILNRFRNDLGVTALGTELEGGAQSTEEHLRAEAAEVRIEEATRVGNRLEFAVIVRSLAGHKLPTAYPSRRVWLHLTVRDAAGATVFESGRVARDGSIEGNDNDLDPARFEPHYQRIQDAAQVQIWEAVMGDPAGSVTTGLLTASQYLKDNRILPEGFDKSTAPPDVAPYGEAARDSDFTGGSDRVEFSVDPGNSRGPYEIEAGVWYQPIAFRWARNLKDHPAPETDRFTAYFDAMAGATAVRLASAVRSSENR